MLDFQKSEARHPETIRSYEFCKLVSHSCDGGIDLESFANVQFEGAADIVVVVVVVVAAAAAVVVQFLWLNL